MRLQRGVDADAAVGAQTSRADKLLAMAGVLIRRKSFAAARDACILAAQLDRSLLRDVRGAALLARAGYPADAERARQQLAGSLSLRAIQIGDHRIRGEVFLARGDASRAWVEFQRAAALEAPGVLTEYLARGADASGEHGTALALYRRMATDPGYYWRYPDSDVPGTWANAFATYLSLVRVHAPDTDVAGVERLGRALRHPLVYTRVNSTPH
jgi:hypothetical protein